MQYQRLCSLLGLVEWVPPNGHAHLVHLHAHLVHLHAVQHPTSATQMLQLNSTVLIQAVGSPKVIKYKHRPVKSCGSAMRLAKNTKGMKEIQEHC
jgi:hypothetical protein